MCRKTALDEQYRPFVPVASDGTFLCRLKGKFWFVPEISPSAAGAVKICRASLATSRAINKAAERSPGEIAAAAIRKAGKPM